MFMTGGLNVKAQEAALRLGPDIVIATPGRLIDHLHNAPNFHLNSIEVLILDEADRCELYRRCQQAGYGLIKNDCSFEHVNSQAWSLLLNILVRSKSVAYRENAFIV